MKRNEYPIPRLLRVTTFSSFIAVSFLSFPFGTLIGLGIGVSCSTQSVVNAVPAHWWRVSSWLIKNPQDVQVVLCCIFSDMSSVIQAYYSGVSAPCDSSVVY